MILYCTRYGVPIHRCCEVRVLVTNEMRNNYYDSARVAFTCETVDAATHFVT
jgi:hypothetical protein